MSWFDEDAPPTQEPESEEILPAELDTAKPFKDHVRRLLELAEKDAELKEAYDRVHREFKAHELAVHTMMENAGDESRKVDVGPPYGTYSFVPNETIRGRVLNPVEFQKWLEERAMVDEFSKPGWSGRRLNEFARDVVEGTEELPPGFDFSRTRYVTKTKAKPKKKKRA